MTESKAEALALTVQHWLEYQIACRREMLLSESYLAQPVGEFLRAHHSGKIVAEWAIPGLRTGQRGRPKQLDYALLSRDSSRLTTAIEAKWIRTSGQGETQRIVDDLLRLERIRSGTPGQSVSRYFLVAGTSTAFNQKFLQLQIRSSGSMQAFLPPLLDSVSKSVNQVRIESSTEPWRGYFRSFGTSYKVDLPKAFSTKLVFISPGSVGQVGIAIWRIASNSRRSPIKASAL